MPDVDVSFVTRIFERIYQLGCDGFQSNAIIIFIFNFDLENKNLMSLTFVIELKFRKSKFVFCM